MSLHPASEDPNLPEAAAGAGSVHFLTKLQSAPEKMTTEPDGLVVEEGKGASVGEPAAKSGIPSPVTSPIPATAVPSVMAPLESTFVVDAAQRTERSRPEKRSTAADRFPATFRRFPAPAAKSGTPSRFTSPILASPAGPVKSFPGVPPVGSTRGSMATRYANPSSTPEAQLSSR